MEKSDLINIIYNFTITFKSRKISLRDISSIVSDIKDKYVDLIYNSIYKGDIHFKDIRKNGYFRIAREDKYSPYQLCIRTDLKHNDGYAFTHEMGHAIDNKIVGDKIEYYSNTYLIEGYQDTLNNIVKKEVKKNKDYLFNVVFSRFKELIDFELGDGNFDVYLNDCNTIKEYKSLSRKVGGCYIGYSSRAKKRPEFKENVKKFEKLKAIVISPEFKARRKRIRDSKSVKIIDQELAIIIDTIDIYESMCLYCFKGHSKGYFKRPGMVGSEFFANMFQMEAIDKLDVQLKNVSMLLHMSYDAFYKLLNHIMRIK